jgi:CreA protein
MGKIEWAGESTAALSVSDYGKALAWYRDVLGFEVVFELETWGWAQLQSPVGGLLVGIGQSEEVKQGGGATLTFTVKDIDAARAYLEGEIRPIRRRDLAGRGHGQAGDVLRPGRQRVDGSPSS